ncbi:hypothetical protein MFIFM68171_08002 [Madurella fahalii]|uniref:Glycoside hydrolase 35 catalytic domain-containing protein n=1 Tax=Madurella fahalii TaxID=1157608 RepID=A0ABQ0GJ44_9PEZI
MNDGMSGFKCGYLLGALSVVNGNDPGALSLNWRRSFIDVSSLDSLMNGEIWSTWFDLLIPQKGNSSNRDSSGEIDWMLNQGYNFSIFMFYGGTSWGFGNGAGGPDPILPYNTSYDYGAVLDETRRMTVTYDKMRFVITKHVSNVPTTRLIFPQGDGGSRTDVWVYLYEHVATPPAKLVAGTAEY